MLSKRLLSITIALFAACQATLAWLPSRTISQRTNHQLPRSYQLRVNDRTCIWTRRLSRSVIPLGASTLEQSDKAALETTAIAPVSKEDRGLTMEQKVINALFLTAAFGYALYTILNIDHGMTRGWTTSEIAMRVPLDNWGAYESYLANKPVVTKTLINVIIYLLGDWLSQTTFQGKNVLDFDISRTLKNGLIGLCFGPLVHEYYQFSDTILPPENGLLTRLEKIVMDQTIYLTVKCSIYISAVGLLGGDDWPTVKQTVRDKMGGVVITAWKFWPLVHCITYGLVPARHRILWVNSVDLVWNAILATQAQKDQPEEKIEEAEVASDTVLESRASASDGRIAPVVVLDNNDFVADKEDLFFAVTLNSSTKPGSNTTVEAVA